MPITLLKYAVFGALTGTTLLGNFSQSGAFLTTPSYGDITLSVYKEPDAIEVWIEKLVVLESEGKNGAVVLDANGRYSYGCLQFQKRTFIEFGEKHKLLSENDIAHIDERILDCKLQKQLARLIVENDEDGWKHWYTSVMKRGLGIPPRRNGQGILLSANTE